MGFLANMWRKGQKAGIEQERERCRKVVLQEGIRLQQLQDAYYPMYDYGNELSIVQTILEAIEEQPNHDQ